MTNHPRPPAADPARPDGGEALQHRAIHVGQRKADPIQFPHGYELWAAAWMLHSLFQNIDHVNDGHVTPDGFDILPMIEAGKALSKALALSLETNQIKGIET